MHYAAGRRAWGAAGARWPAAHALLAWPALAAALLSALTDGVDYRIAQGVMLWSSGGGCSWLSLALGGPGAAPAACALVYLGSLLATPLHTALLCGRAALPSLPGVLRTASTTALPFAAGALTSALLGSPPAPAAPPPRSVHVAALALLYAECCERLCDAEAIVHPSHVMVALALGECGAGRGGRGGRGADGRGVCAEAGGVLASAAGARCTRAGLLSAAEARLVARVAVPRRLEAGGALGCAARGLCRLPGVFVAPAQALLLAVLAHDDSEPPSPLHDATVGFQ
ncbi:uncharacterized protein LOC126056382 [Helicoverpa armigera]|uniref:uncharacterized protein LOC126056382 n=1 Tax=Helicoverpa armigera TaxID=29058 RepID=UPI003083A18A